MQLFITDDFKIWSDYIIINEDRIIQQLRKVLRAKSWYNFFLQAKTFKWVQKRYLCEIVEIKNFVKAKILSVEERQIESTERGVITSILNKFDKMELIVQKLTELSIPIIWFVPTQRSKFKEIPQKKLERFNKICLEAVEQSFWWFLPKIQVYSNLEKIKWKKAILNFDGIPASKANWDLDFLIIWPEWGFTDQDIKKISPDQTIKLGETVLRAETASIVWGYELVRDL